MTVVLNFQDFILNAFIKMIHFMKTDWKFHKIASLNSILDIQLSRSLRIFLLLTQIANKLIFISCTFAPTLAAHESHGSVLFDIEILRLEFAPSYVSKQYEHDAHQ